VVRRTRRTTASWRWQRALSGYGVLIDIDDQRKAEEALREGEYKLRQIIETVPSLLWSLEPDGEQTQLNQRALDYIGVRFEDLLDFGWNKFLHPDDLTETTSAFSHAIQTGTSYQAVHRLRRADGEYRWHHARGEPLRDRQGRVIQWYGRVRFKVMRSTLSIRRIDGGSADGDDELSDEEFLAFLEKHPDLRDRFGSIVSAVENSEGNLKKADAAEERILEEMRHLGREAMQGWAERQVGTMPPSV
jgi:PAS domain S-box-containing protein